MDQNKIWVVIAALLLAIFAAELSSAEKFPIIDFVNKCDQNVSFICRAVERTILKPGQKVSLEASFKNYPNAYDCEGDDSSVNFLDFSAYNVTRDKEHQHIHWKFNSVGAYLSYDNIHWTLGREWESD
ncbi:unnamed protein product [Cuscuta europaea]|uniref:S-protein homolog n=1 Tax=Cuscuta europaea TaxID=41803 RepID=A0A9P0YPS4_CUSEU|nr:unnamed protein product [Cuscuta europaea]